MSKFKVGDKVVYIADDRYNGIQGIVEYIEENGTVNVTYTCEKARDLWSESLRTYNETPKRIRKLTKLDKALS